MPFRSFLLAAAAAVSLAPAASAGWSEWQLAGEAQITGEPAVVITASRWSRRWRARVMAGSRRRWAWSR